MTAPRLHTSVAARALAEDGHPVGEIVRRLEALGHTPSTVYAALGRARAARGETFQRKPRIVQVSLSEEVWQRLADRAAEEHSSVARIARTLLTRASRTLARTDLTPCP